MVLGEPCFWQELQENCCKHFKTTKHKVMTSPMSVSQSDDITNVCLINIHFVIICSNQKAVFVGELPNIMNIYSKPSCEIIIICFPRLDFPRLFHTAPSNSKARQVPSYCTGIANQLHWVPLTTSSVTTNTQLQRAGFFASK